MTTTVQAMYEHGCLHLIEPVAIPDGSRVNVVISSSDQSIDNAGLSNAGGEAQLRQGLIDFLLSLPAGTRCRSGIDQQIRNERLSWDSST